MSLSAFQIKNASQNHSAGILLKKTFFKKGIQKKNVATFVLWTTTLILFPLLLLWFCPFVDLMVICMRVHLCTAYVC